MNNNTSDFGNYVIITVNGDDVEACRAEAIRLAHDRVFSDGRSAEVRTGLTGYFGGAFVTGAEATITFA